MGAAMADLERSKPSKACVFFVTHHSVLAWKSWALHPAEGLSRCSLAAQTLGHLTPEPTCHVREHGAMVTPEPVNLLPNMFPLKFWVRKQWSSSFETKSCQSDTSSHWATQALSLFATHDLQHPRCGDLQSISDNLTLQSSLCDMAWLQPGGFCFNEWNIET